MIVKEIQKDVNFCLCRNGRTRKIFKILFQNNKPDFYVLFPYFDAKEYQIGTMSIPEGESGLPEFNVTNNKKASSSLPVKFSYHLDGNVHFKPTNPVKALVSLAFKYDSILATPISELSGEHIFTVTFEDLDCFRDLIPSREDKDTLNLIALVPDDAQTFKATGFAGATRESVCGKYGITQPMLIELKRPQLASSLFIAIYLLSGAISIQNGPHQGPFITSIVGFRKADVRLDRKLTTLYLYAKGNSGFT